MNREQVIKYLKNVLEKWEAFCLGHPPFAQAIKTLLDEVKGNANNK